MNKKEMLLIEGLLIETVDKYSGGLKTLCANQSKRRGILEGAQIGLVALEGLKRGIPPEVVFSSLDSRINQSIYSLFVAEDKCKFKEDSLLTCEIAYSDNLTTTLQLIRTRLSVLVR